MIAAQAPRLPPGSSGTNPQRPAFQENGRIFTTSGKKMPNGRAVSILTVFFVIGALAPREAHLVIGLLSLAICAVLRPSAVVSGLNRSLWFWGIIALSFIVTIPAMFFLKYSFYEVLKGAYYLIRLPLFLLLGYAAFWVLKTRDGLLKSICFSAAISAIAYMTRYMLDSSIAAEVQAGDRTYIRDTLGAGSYLWAIAIGVALAFPKIFGRWRHLIVYAIVGIIAAAIIISTGRTSVIWVALLLAILFGPTLKSTIPLQAFFTVVFCFFFFTLTPFLMVGLGVVSNGWYESIGYIEESIPIARYSLPEVNTHWRGFETFLAYRYVFNLQGPWFLWGTGLGESVPLGFNFNLGGENVTSIPIFHNGFSLLLVRSGLLGMALFVVGNLRLLKGLTPKLSNAGPRHISDLRISKLGYGIVLMMLLAFPTIAGLYHGGEGGSSIPFIIGYLTAYLRTTRFIDDEPVIKIDRIKQDSTA